MMGEPGCQVALVGNKADLEERRQVCFKGWAGGEKGGFGGKAAGKVCVQRGSSSLIQISNSIVNVLFMVWAGAE